MIPDDITTALTERFGGENCRHMPPDAWQVELDGTRLIAISSDVRVKLMMPIMPIAEAQPFIQQMMEANFDDTQETRYAIHQEAVWGVFQYDLAALTCPQFESAVEKLLTLKAEGADVFFSRMVEDQVRQIIVASKRQGQTLEGTLKTLDRFYAEGMMGNMGDRDRDYQRNALASWQRQLKRLWPMVEIEDTREGTDHKAAES